MCWLDGSFYSVLSPAVRGLPLAWRFGQKKVTYHLLSLLRDTCSCADAGIPLLCTRCAYNTMGAVGVEDFRIFFLFMESTRFKTREEDLRNAHERLSCRLMPILITLG